MRERILLPYICGLPSLWSKHEGVAQGSRLRHELSSVFPLCFRVLARRLLLQHYRSIYVGLRSIHEFLGSECTGPSVESPIEVGILIQGHVE